VVKAESETALHPEGPFPEEIKAYFAFRLCHHEDRASIQQNKEPQEGKGDYTPLE
jgi:hypothetical protein